MAESETTEDRPWRLSEFAVILPFSIVSQDHSLVGGGGEGMGCIAQRWAASWPVPSQLVGP